MVADGNKFGLKNNSDRGIVNLVSNFAGHKSPPRRQKGCMKQGLFEVSVLSREKNQPVREYGFQGRTFVEGRKGVRFAIKIKNNSPNRVLAVPSVDGQSVIDGLAASDSSRGYIIAGYSSVEIAGWRVSLDSVAQFVFEDKKKSYAANGGNGSQNCGVIGVQVFEEKQQQQLGIVGNWPITYPAPPNPWHPYPHDPLWPTKPWWDNDPHARPYWPYWKDSPITCETSASTRELRGGKPFGSTVKAANNSTGEDFTLGTGWGGQQEHVVTEDRFESGELLGLLEIYYTDRKSLVSMGVDMTKAAQVSAPRAFPKSFSSFCKPPAKAVS